MGIEEYERPLVTRHQFVCHGLQVEIQAQAHVQARGRLTIEQVFPLHGQGRVTLQAAQVRVQAGFEPRLTIDGVGITYEGTQGRIGIVT